jgi:hypothetical protein
MGAEHIEEALKLGIEVNRFHHNDGSVNIMAGSGDDRKVIAHVLCQTPYKRGEGYRTICEERDDTADFIVRAVNSYDAMVKVLTAIEADYSRVTAGNRPLWYADVVNALARDGGTK